MTLTDPGVSACWHNWPIVWPSDRQIARGAVLPVTFHKSFIPRQWVLRATLSVQSLRFPRQTHQVTVFMGASSILLLSRSLFLPLTTSSSWSSSLLGAPFWNVFMKQITWFQPTSCSIPCVLTGYFYEARPLLSEFIPYCLFSCLIFLSSVSVFFEA